MNSEIEFIEKELEGLRIQLKEHSLYKNLQSVNDVRVFMESHVFAVWDFMSLLKALQLDLTAVTLPWVPKENTNLVRFINEITLAEESDLDKDGQIKSHFEMYLDSMQEMDADIDVIKNFVSQISKGDSVLDTLKRTAVLPEVKEFVAFTFDVINSNEAHKIASAFTFGREEVIPDMFLEIVEKSSCDNNQKFENFIYYLKRHIELDGDEHGPLSLKMVAELCGDDQTKWGEVLEVAKKALQVRVNLWTGIEVQLKKYKKELV